MKKFCALLVLTLWAAACFPTVLLADPAADAARREARQNEMDKFGIAPKGDQPAGENQLDLSGGTPIPPESPVNGLFYGDTGILAGQGGIGEAPSPFSPGVAVDPATGQVIQPAFFDLGQIQEVPVTGGGTDVSQATGGIGINIVTKRGSTGSFPGANGFFTNTQLQQPQFKIIENESPRPVDRIFLTPDCGPFGCTPPGVNPFDMPGWSQGMPGMQNFPPGETPFPFPGGPVDGREVQFTHFNSIQRPDLVGFLGFPDTNQAIAERTGFRQVQQSSTDVQ